MTDDYCATLCLHWAGNLPGGWTGKVWSATQFSYTCWCGTAEDSIDTGAWLESNRVPDDQWYDRHCSATSCLPHVPQLALLCWVIIGAVPGSNKPCEGDKTMMCGGPSLNHVMLVECSDGGWELCIALLLACSIYLVGGALWTHRSQGTPLTKERLMAGELLPHRLFWMGVSGLVVDGVRFTRTLGRARGTHPGQGREGAAELLMGDKARRSSADTGHSGKSRGSSKVSKSKKEKKSKKGSASETAPPSKGKKGKEESSGGHEPAFAPAPLPAPPSVNLGRQETDMTDAFGNILLR